MSAPSGHHGGMDRDLIAATVSELFGPLVDADEFIQKNMGPDQADLHVPSSMGKRKPSKNDEARRHKRQAQVGLASNVLGITAGGAALTSAARDPRFADPGAPKWARRVARAGSKVPAPIARLGSTPTRAAGLAAGAVGLQAANLGGDLVANRVLSRESKKRVVSKAAGTNFVKGRFGGFARAQRRQEKAYATYQPNILVSEMDRVRPKWRKGETLTALGLGGAVGMAGQEEYKRARPKVKRVVQENTPKVKAAASRAGRAVSDAAEEGKRRLEGVVKADAERKQAFGWLNVVHKDGKPVIDRQSDHISIEEMEKSAYQYVRESRTGGHMHRRAAFGDQPVKAADMIESFVVTPEKLEAMGVPGEVAKSIPVAWWGGYQITDDDVWEDVRSGKLTGFSIHGRGRRVEKDLDELVGKREFPTYDTDDAKRLASSKNRQVAFSLGASSLGLSALGVKAGGTGLRRMAARGMKASTPMPRERVAQLNRRARKFDDASTSLAIGASGIGGAGGFNFAAQQRREAKNLRKSMDDRKAQGKEVVRRVVSSPRTSQHPDASRKRRQDAAIGGLTGTGATLAIQGQAQRQAAIANTAKYKRLKADNNVAGKAAMRIKGAGDKPGAGAAAAKQAAKAARTKTGVAAALGTGAYGLARYRRGDRDRRLGDWYQ